MNKLLPIILAITMTFGINSRAQNLYFPPLSGDAWDTLSPVSLGWCPDKVDSLLQYVGSRNTKAFIVLKDGKIVIEKYYGSFTRDSSWYWASAGKTLTAFTIGIAQQEHFLSIEDSSARYLGNGWTSCPPVKEGMIRIRHQLTMTSGLNDAVADPHCTDDTCLQYLADTGTRWAYHNGPYTLLDEVIRNATGQTLNTYFTQKVKNPTGMTGAFFKLGYDNVYLSKARSMARFGLLILGRGYWNGTPVLNDTAYFQQMTTRSQQLNKSYGYLWWLNGQPSFMLPTLQFVFPGPLNPAAPPDMIAAIGKNGQLINVVPSQKLVFIRMGEVPGSGEVPVLFNDTVWQKLNAAMCPAPVSVVSAANRNAPRIYPNPAPAFFQVEWPGHTFDGSLEDLSGRRVWQQKACRDAVHISTAALPPGLYLLCLTQQGYKQYYRLLVPGT